MGRFNMSEHILSLSYGKDYTEKQILVWYNKLHNDGAEYKMWGNGIALPCALYVMEGIIDTAKGDYHERKH
jgi:hypothetical protein